MNLAHTCRAMQGDSAHNFCGQAKIQGKQDHVMRDCMLCSEAHRYKHTVPNVAPCAAIMLSVFPWHGPVLMCV